MRASRRLDRRLPRRPSRARCGVTSHSQRARASSPRRCCFLSCSGRSTTRKTAACVQGRLSAHVMAYMRDAVTRDPAIDAIVFQDDPQQRPTLFATFGGLLPLAVELETGRSILVSLEGAADEGVRRDVPPGAHVLRVRLGRRQADDRTPGIDGRSDVQEGRAFSPGMAAKVALVLSPPMPLCPYVLMPPMARWATAHRPGHSPRACRPSPASRRGCAAPIRGRVAVRLVRQHHVAPVPPSPLSAT